MRGAVFVFDKVAEGKKVIGGTKAPTGPASRYAPAWRRPEPVAPVVVPGRRG
jgi:hypothetical protein